MLIYFLHSLSHSSVLLFFVYKYIYSIASRRKILSIVDMEIEQTIPSINTDTDLIIPNSRVFISNRSRDFLGLPKRIDGECIDDERCSWCRSILSNKR
jgi:hypothetical protein